MAVVGADIPDLARLCVEAGSPADPQVEVSERCSLRPDYDHTTVFLEIAFVHTSLQEACLEVKFWLVLWIATPKWKSASMAGGCRKTVGVDVGSWEFGAEEGAYRKGLGGRV